MLNCSYREAYVAHSMSDHMLELSSGQMRELLQMEPYSYSGTDFTAAQVNARILFAEFCLRMSKFRKAELKALTVEMAISKAYGKRLRAGKVACPECGVVVIPPLLSGTPDKNGLKQ